MSKRIAITPYAPSNSAKALKEEFDKIDGITSILCRSRGTSSYIPRENDLIINWGRSTPKNNRFEHFTGSTLNSYSSSAFASNKIDTMRILQENNINCVLSTTDRDIAQGWLEDGCVVFARTLLNSHSGGGIVVCSNQVPEHLGTWQHSTELVNARLYTKEATPERHREFRIHTFGGEVIHTQLKKRRNGYRELGDAYSEVVRNHSSGWIYASSEGTSPANSAAIESAKAAVSALGLDFGAVDIITRGEDAWVLEVNTAPGLTGTTLTKYVEAFKKIAFPEPIEENTIVEESRYTDGAFYKIMLGGRLTLGQYIERRSCFEIIGSNQLWSESEFDNVLEKVQ